MWSFHIWCWDLMQPKLIWKSGIIVDVRRTENRIDKYLWLNMLQITCAYPMLSYFDSINLPLLIPVLPSKQPFHHNI